MKLRCLKQINYQKRSIAEMIINLNDKNYVILTTKQLKDAFYNKRSGDINFSNLVRLLSKKWLRTKIKQN